MTKRFNIDEIRTIINTVPGHFHSIPPSMEEQKLSSRIQGGAIYVNKDELIKRFEEAKETK